ncbi:MAG TPA: cupin domain-containing protein [Candidatus Tectomicrobia bacterium]|nr:cupin domain-containing protein [Candidatus Tectomicrobia bacterium]
MRTLHSVVVALTFALGSLLAPPTWAASQPKAGAPLMAAPSDLTWADVPSLPPGAKIAVIQGPLNEAVPFTFRLKVPAGYKIPVHTHPAIEHVTVMSGTLYFAGGDTFDEASVKTLTPGSVVVMPAGHPMYGWTKEETIIQVHGVGPWGIDYLTPADDPRKK